jgi:4-hydroxy-3-polyprenylbenzoate decarboxylase
MALLDLRTFLDKTNDIGELKVIRGADKHLEIGAITEISLQNDGPALLFDDIPGFPAGWRVATNVCSTRRRGLLALGLDPGMTRDEFMAVFKKRWDGYEPIPPKVVEDGPILENIRTGADIDLRQFPVPLWHELDGGPYIGTGDAVVHQDPENGFVNVGTYRVQMHDDGVPTIFTEPESDGRRIMEKYWKQGKPAPIAISFGPEPLVFLSGCSANGLPRTEPEYNYTGFLAGEPIEVIRGQATGLLISAHSEIAIEGEVSSPEVEYRMEGPFGEWTGYYEAEKTPEPVIHVKTLYFRNDPILYGCPPLQHRFSYSFMLPLRSIQVISRLEKAGIEACGATNLVPFGCNVISIRQNKPDDVKQAMDILASMGGPNRLFIIVDHDVDAEDPYDVLWALGSRFDPEQAKTSIIGSQWLLDPLRPMEHRSSREAMPYKRMILNGCRPFHRLGDFPPVNKLSDARRRDTWAKWNMADWLQDTAEPKFKVAP